MAPALLTHHLTTVNPNWDPLTWTLLANKAFLSDTLWCCHIQGPSLLLAPLDLMPSGTPKHVSMDKPIIPSCSKYQIQHKARKSHLDVVLITNHDDQGQS
jgi:hypothetical protein